MNRLTDLVALAGIIAAVIGLFGRLNTELPYTQDMTTRGLSLISAAVLDQGLQRRVDVTIQIDGSEVATGYSRPGCDGLLLIAPPPRTAQGLDRVAPRLDFGDYRIRYAYGGVWHDEVPKLERFVKTLKADFRFGAGALSPRLLAVADAGDCELLDGIEQVLVAYSLGRDDFFHYTLMGSINEVDTP